MKNGIILFLIAVSAFIVFLPSFTRLQDIKEKNRAFKARINQLQDEQVELKEEVRRLKEDPVYLEKIARDRMGLVKEGEVIYKIVPPEEE